MPDEALRAVVYEAVARHLRAEPAIAPSRAHASHVMLAVRSGEAVGDGACLIEPAVACDHCGCCRSFGH